MDTINWSDYNYADFTKICNAILLFEVSKSVQPFSAPGRDGGIDGSFTGNYGGKQGTWRFQYKFHKVARKQGFSLLRSELVSEIADLKNENFFVLLTNVELLPQEVTQLKDIFQTETSKKASSCEFLIWDGAKIQALVIGHPLISLWLNDGFQTAQLQDYKTFFKRGLEAAGFEPYTLNNQFIGRDKYKTDLKGFLNGPKLMAILIGEAGIGKTRLALEFFSEVVDKMQNSYALVLASKNVDFDKLHRALAGDHHYLILIDDAHKYSAADIADMKQLSELSDGRIKLLLTARSIVATTALSQLKESDADLFLQMNLAVLDRPETLAAFTPYTKGSYYEYYQDDLVNISHGRPVLVVAILRAISENTQISKLLENDFLKSYVSNYFQAYYDEVSKETGASIVQVKALLQNIALIEPVSFAHSELRQKLVELYGWSLPHLNYALDLLRETSIVEGRYEQSIKPDYYSDILLQGINQDTAAACISEFNEYLDNIVVNLSSIEGFGNTRLLDEILQIYVGSIESDDAEKLVPLEKRLNIVYRILKTMGHIVYVKPAISANAVKLYIKSLSKEDHPIALDWQTTQNNAYPLTDTMMNKVILILSRLLSLPEYYDFVYRSIFELYELTQDKKLATIYQFEKRDVVDNFSLNRQQYFLDRLKARPQISVKDYALVRQVFQRFLALEFTSTELSAAARDNLVIRTYYLSATENVIKLRMTVLSQLEKYYDHTGLEDDRFETLKLLLDIPRSIFATQRNPHLYINDTEQDQVLNFLESRAGDFGLLEQREVLDKVFWYTKWGIDAKYQEQLERIKAGMKPKNLSEIFSQTFSKAETALMEYGDVKSFIANKCDELVAIYSAEEMAVAMKAFLEPQPYPPHYFWEFLDVLLKKHLDYGMAFYDYLLDEGSPILYQYGSSVLYNLRFENHEMEFWKRVRALETMDNWQADNIIILAYGRRVPGTAELTELDIEAILKVCAKANPESNHSLAGGLQTLISAGYRQSKEVVASFLDRAHQREAEMFFIWLMDNPKATPDLIKDLILYHTVRFFLSYEIERALQYLLEQFGSTLVWQYLKSRFDHKKEEVMQTRSLLGYDIVPVAEHSRLGEGQEDKKNELFSLSLNWFLEEDNDGGHLFYAKNLLEYLRPSKAISEAIANIYDKLLNKNAQDLEKLGRLADSLSVFQAKNALLVSVVIKAYGFILEIPSPDEEKKGYYLYYLQNALTSVGVKMGKPGEPFQVDLDLRELLESELSNIPAYSEAKNFLNKVLKSLNESINRERFDNETW